MQSWLVTGAGGILGANAGFFLRRRATAVGFFRSVRPEPNLFSDCLRGSIEDESDVRKIISRVRPEVVLHCAALSRHETCEKDPLHAWETNVEGTRSLARWANQVGSRFVYISTDAVFDGERGLYSEDSIPNPFSVYGQTKLAGEKAATDECDALIVRTNFFGWSPSGRSSILEFFYNSLSDGQRVKGFTDFYVTSMYAQHLMEAIWRLLEREVTGVVHVASRDSLAKYNFAAQLADVFGFDPSLIDPSSEQEEAREWVKGRDISLNTNYYRDLTGYALPSQREGLLSALADRANLRPWILSRQNLKGFDGEFSSDLQQFTDFERGGS